MMPEAVLAVIVGVLMMIALVIVLGVATLQFI